MDAQYTPAKVTTRHIAGTSRDPDLPPGTPDWITAEKIRETQRVWQPRSREPVTVEVAIEMLINVRRLADVLYPDDTGDRPPQTHA